MNDLEIALRDIGNVGNIAEAAANRFAQQAGQLVDIAYMTIASPIGDLVLAATPKGLLRIGFDNETGVLEHLAEHISPRILEFPSRLEQSRLELDEYFTGRRESFDMPLDREAHCRVPTRGSRCSGQDPIWGSLDLPRGGPQGRAAERCPGGRAGAGWQPDPGRDPLSSRSPNRGRHGRIRRWNRP